MMPNAFKPSRFKKPALVLAVAALCGLGLAGCNDDDDMVSNPTPTPMPTGDLIALTESGQIASVNRSAPTALVSTQTVSGLKTNDSLIGIDYRPADGKLYGVGALGNIYIIDPSTGVATFKVALTADATDTTSPFVRITGNASLMSLDFNPVPDRLRVVGNDGQNLRINVDTGATFTDTALNGGGSPIVTAVAYTNSFAGAGSTRMFNIDVNQDRLYLQNPPNDGTLSSFASLGVNANGSSGFDIDGMNNMGYAALKVGSALQLHSINLGALGTETVAASLLGALPASLGDVRGIALKPAMTTGVTVQGLSANNQLVSFSPLTPSMTTSKAITGLMTGETIVGIDYRLRTESDKSGVLYGLSNLGNLYIINSDTGAATGKLALTADPTDTSAPFAGLAGTAFAVDFNPVPDRIRVLSNTGQSLRINVDTGVTITDGAINGVTGAVVSAAAYTNSFQRLNAGTTMLLDLDQTSNQLLLQSPPNDGTVAPIGAFGAALTLSASNGMDIAGGDNGLVLATNGAGLYRINLMTGAATELAPKVGSATTPALIDLAILLK
ncbi:MAG: DUF4394 domain-containing protein [Moraxellaceae bacterium]